MNYLYGLIRIGVRNRKEVSKLEAHEIEISVSKLLFWATRDLEWFCRIRPDYRVIRY
jgi:hypothetical protein